MRGLMMAAALVLAVPIGAESRELKGRDVYSACVTDYANHEPYRAYCDALAEGLSTGIDFGSYATHYKLNADASWQEIGNSVASSLGYCIPDGTVAAQVNKAFRDYLSWHEMAQNRTLPSVFANAMRAKFPCD